MSARRRDESLVEQIIKLNNEVRKLKRFNRIASLNPAVSAIAASSGNPNHSHAEHLLVSNFFNSPLLWYGNTPQLRLQHNANQYTQYDELGRVDFGSDPQQKQASIYARRGEAGGVGDLPSDIVFEIVPDGSASIVTAMEILYSRRFTLNGITSIYNKTGDADILDLYDETDTLIHRFERDGDYTVAGASSAGLQHIIQNTTASGTTAFVEWFGGVNGNNQAISVGASITGYTGSYYGDYAWLGARNRDLYLFADGGGVDNKAIYFTTGTGPTAVTSRGNINASGLILSTGARINEFSTDGTLSGNSDIAAPTEKAVKTYVDAKDHDHTTPIATHAAIAGAHHTRFTSAEAVDAIEAVTDLGAAPASTDDVIFNDAGTLKQTAFSDLDETTLTGIKAYVDGLIDDLWVFKNIDELTLSNNIGSWSPNYSVAEVEAQCTTNGSGEYSYIWVLFKNPAYLDATRTSLTIRIYFKNAGSDDSNFNFTYWVSAKDYSTSNNTATSYNVLSSSLGGSVSNSTVSGNTRYFDRTVTDADIGGVEAIGVAFNIKNFNPSGILTLTGIAIQVT